MRASSRQRSAVGFALSTRDRVDLTRRALAGLVTDGPFDLIWVDGSATPEGQALPGNVDLGSCRLAELHRNVVGGPDQAIRFGLKRLLDLGYEYCGLVENDIRLTPGWFAPLMRLFELGKADGLRVGAVTVGGVRGREFIRRRGYLVMWLVGARMVLFTQEAARIVLDTYRPVDARKLARFYRRMFDVDLRHVWELFMDQPNRALGCDWAYTMNLYRHGFASLATPQSMAFNMDFDLEQAFRTSYFHDALPTSDEDDRRFAHLIARMTRLGAGRRTVARSLQAVGTALFWAQQRSQLIGRVLHPVRAARALYTRCQRWVLRQIHQIRPGASYRESNNA